MTIYECIHIVTCIFIIEYVHILLEFSKTTFVCRELLEYVANARGSWFLMKGAPPWGC